MVIKNIENHYILLAFIVWIIYNKFERGKS